MGPERAKRVALLLGSVIAPFVIQGCSEPAPPAAERLDDAGAAARFVDVTTRAGLLLRADRGTRGGYFMPDSMAGGCAFVDFDRDGALDIYVVRGAWGGEPGSGANRLYRQERDGRFSNVSERSGAADAGYGMGVAVGDIDNDGDDDLFVSNYGPDVLLRNNGNGTFTDVTASAGLGDPRWGASAGFLDYDGDGFLDLFVTNYLDYTPDVRAFDAGGRPEYPGPDCCRGVPDLLYRNNGDGTFTDVSRVSGIASRTGKGLGVAFLDLDGDGRVDIYVANDGEANRAWIQVGDGRFLDRAPEMGLAFNQFGDAEASMGIAVGDANGDLEPDLLLTHLFQETNTLYVGRGGGRFADETVGSGLGPPSLDFTGFGAVFFDPDLDGDLDLLVSNGRVLRAPSRAADARTHWAPYAEPLRYFENDGKGRFRVAYDTCGALCEEVDVGRGLAVGDVDDDGDPDVLAASASGGVRLCRTEWSGTAHWLGVRALETTGPRDALGAVVFVETDQRTLRREILRTASYLSSQDPRALFGLRGGESLRNVVVRWPCGCVERFGPLDTDRYHELLHGSGKGPRQRHHG